MQLVLAAMMIVACVGFLLSPSPTQLRLPRPQPARSACCYANGAEAEMLRLTPCGGLTKTILKPAPTDATVPPWGALVSVLFTGRFENGTVFDSKFAESPFEFQLNAGIVVDGMGKGVASMSVGERALLRCESRWAYGAGGVPGHIPPNATLTYEVELQSWKKGPPIDDQDFDLETYKASLSGREAASGLTRDGYEWVETGEDVTLWLPLDESEGARDVTCEFHPREFRLRVGRRGDEAAASPRVEIGGALRGRVISDECYWVIDDERDGGRALQVVLLKAGAFTRWDGVLQNEVMVVE